MEKIYIDKIIDFCQKYNIPELNSKLQMFQLIWNEKYDKFSNKHVAEQEIWNEFTNVYSAYWNPKTYYFLNRFKPNFEMPEYLVPREELSDFIARMEKET